MSEANWFGDPRYGHVRRLDGWTFGDAVEATREALGEQGFGVLTEIDVKATLKKKLDAEFRNYLILGACKPPLAHQALSHVHAIGLLLPCNVVVTEEDDGTPVVAIIDANAMFEVIGDDELQPIAAEVTGQLQAALESIG